MVRFYADTHLELAPLVVARNPLVGFALLYRSYRLANCDVHQRFEQCSWQNFKTDSIQTSTQTTDMAYH